MKHSLPARMLAGLLTGLAPGAALATIDTPAAVDAVRSYTGVAQRRDGTVAYTEYHTARFDAEGRVVTARTEYRDPAGTTVAILESDFTLNLAAPSYRYEDVVSGEIHGIRLENGAYILFRQAPEQPETRRTLPADFAPESLVVGCQGLHYYLRENLPTLQASNRIPIKLLIPGELDYYNFEMRHDGETDGGLVNISIVIKNRFLRLFAPSLNVVYDSHTGDLLTYRGISNITDDRGKLQNVTITYSYDADNWIAVAAAQDSRWR